MKYKIWKQLFDILLKLILLLQITSIQSVAWVETEFLDTW